MSLHPRKATLAGVLVLAGSGLGLGLAAPALAASPSPTASVLATPTAAPAPTSTTADPNVSAAPVASPSVAGPQAPSIEVPAGNARLNGTTNGSDGDALTEILGLAAAGSLLVGGATVVLVRRRS